MSIETVLEKMWQDYLLLNPEAQRVVDTLVAEGESIVNDHIALRTFNVGVVALEECAKPFLAMGYEEKDTYFFDAKRLRAKHYEYAADPTIPKIFISELLVNEFSSEFQDIVSSLVARVSADQVQLPSFFHSGRPWDVSASQYETLLEESDYCCTPGLAEGSCHGAVAAGWRGDAFGPGGCCGIDGWPGELHLQVEGGHGARWAGASAARAAAPAAAAHGPAASGCQRGLGSQHG